MCQKGISISAKNPPPPPHHCQKREYQAAVAEVIGNFATLCVEIQRSEFIKEERNKTRMEERKKTRQEPREHQEKDVVILFLFLLSWFSCFLFVIHSHNCLGRVSKVVGRFDILKALTIEQCLQHIELYIEPCIDIKISRAF